MLNQDFIKSVREFAEKEALPSDIALASASLWWVDKYICPINVDFVDREELSVWDNILDKIPIETSGAWDNSEESDNIVRFGIMSFADFWERYDFKRGSKPAARKRFKVLTKKDLTGIDQTLHIYKAETYAYTEIKGKRQRKHAEFYLNKDKKIWEATQELYSRVAGEPVEQNLQDIFSQLRVDMPYMIAPSIEDIKSALDYFKASVPVYKESAMVDALQEFYDNKGIYAGKISNILRSVDFRPYYTGRIG